MQSSTSKISAFFNQKFDFTSINRRFSLVFFTTISAFLFLNFFEPFGIYHEGASSAQDVFVELFVAMSFVFIVLIITQFVVRPFFKHYRTNIGGIFMWFFIEAVLCASVWSFLNYFVGDSLAGLSKPLPSLWIENLVAYVAIMFLPYFLFVTYIYFKDRLTVVKESPKENEETVPQTVTINDEAGETKMLLNIENLLFIQSADNYIEINYLEGDSLRKELIRNSLKNIETALVDFPVIRCHRSFILNTKKIESAKRTTAGFEVKLQNYSDNIIPVSRSYVSELKKFL